MPELPEVETTRRGLEPLLTGRTLVAVKVHNGSLRWPVPHGLSRALAGKSVHGIGRRSKYLLIDCGKGTLIVHLGMTGHLRVVISILHFGHFTRSSLVHISTSAPHQGHLMS